MGRGWSSCFGRWQVAGGRWATVDGIRHTVEGELAEGRPHDQRKDPALDDESPAENARAPEYNPNSPMDLIDRAQESIE
jgi:hypothetical protein